MLELLLNVLLPLSWLLVGVDGGTKSFEHVMLIRRATLVSRCCCWLGSVGIVVVMLQYRLLLLVVVVNVGGSGCTSTVSFLWISSLINRKLLQFQTLNSILRVCHIWLVTLYRMRRNKYEVVVMTATFVWHLWVGRGSQKNHVVEIGFGFPTTSWLCISIILKMEIDILFNSLQYCIALSIS